MNLSMFACQAGICVYGHPGGMATQGPCHCLDGLTNENRRKARQAIYAIRRQEERDIDKLKKIHEAEIEMLKLDLEVAQEEVVYEMNRATAIYEGNMKKKKILRDRIEALEKRANGLIGNTE